MGSDLEEVGGGEDPRGEEERGGVRKMEKGGAEEEGAGGGEEKEAKGRLLTSTFQSPTPPQVWTLWKNVLI